ncbi:hypothetical protein PIROE2DRAFT_1524 [Piromyces sp. E2]|nr:hypothetical protein PIROE2DRAFT_1524 [Piromyces sp. E2]|eukprot:OUM70372.1 hypothetical protein PIROE2DRAFT_1524 [Piromyces sp. E2]
MISNTERNKRENSNNEEGNILKRKDKEEHWYIAINLNTNKESRKEEKKRKELN